MDRIEKVKWVQNYLEVADQDTDDRGKWAETIINHLYSETPQVVCKFKKETPEHTQYCESGYVILSSCGKDCQRFIPVTSTPARSERVNKEELYQQAVKEWGTESQLDMVIEECAELIDAIQKWRRHRVESVKVLEEAVDVELCLEQLKLMLDAPVLFENIRIEKLGRLEKLLIHQQRSGSEIAP